MKFRFLAIYILLSSCLVKAQERRIPDIPDISGYYTLLCDFHLHTVFSDGQVWPTVRVDEAWREGLDAIAISDHLEYLPHKQDIKTQYNRSWQIAREYALNKDLIVIAGTEITKGMPPGHLNALFIKDASTIVNPDYKLAIEEAANQGAFIIWNHPGWKAQQPDTMKWFDEHTFLYEQGWMHGIEVANGTEFYPGAVDWANDRGLTMIGSSDQHAPFLYTELSAEKHRCLTLVFASEKSEGGIREALFNGRTAAYSGKNIVGNAALLEALFIKSVSLKEINRNQKLFSISNKSDLYFELVLEDKLYGDWKKRLSLKPQHEYLLSISEEVALKDIEVRVKNFITASDETLSLPLQSIQAVYK